MIMDLKDAINAQELSVAQIEEILATQKYDDILFAKADEVRKKYCGDEVKMIALLEFSNICRNNCFYCGLRQENTGLKRYGLSLKEIMEHAQLAKSLGFRYIALQSGESNVYSNEEFSAIIRVISYLNLGVILSCGELDGRDLREFKKAGASGYLLKIETTDKKLYHRLHPHQNWMLRNNTINLLSALGYYTATGNIIGLPGQTLRSIAEDILYFKAVHADFIGIGPLMPHKDTPLKDTPKGNLLLTLKTMALCRILNPGADIVTTTALEALAPNGQELGLAAGANVVMPNITNDCVRKDYQLFENKENTNIATSGLRTIINNIVRYGRSVSSDFKL